MRRIRWGMAVSIITALLLGTVNVTDTSAGIYMNQDIETVETATAYYSNKEAQNYTTWASVVQSYLSYDGNQTLMKVYGYYNSSRIDIAYYDMNGNMTSKKTITSELPYFGGFYETASNYYIITGQNNSAEAASVECIRITKFDKSWNRIDSTGIYDCNTSRPFSAGSLRIAECGKYLIIRTSHDTYKDSSGYSTQANMTIELNTQTMKVTDIDSDITDVTQGSVSHSFNQFVQVENNHIIAVDHGDSNPRSIALLKYQTDASTGLFTNTSTYGTVSRTDIITLPSVKENYETDASVGGLEISDSSYLIAGSSLVNSNGTYKTSTVRNAYVASVSKSTGIVTMHWLSDYTSGTSASTPHLVKVEDNKYMVLWSRDGKVNYVMIDGTGNAISKVASISGNLSDCKPIVVRGEVIWYVDVNGAVTFYRIPIPDYTDANITAFVTRLYDTCLGRTADADGLKHWYNLLYTGKLSGAEAGARFVFSDEYTKKKTSDSAYIDMLYHVFMNRESDTSGKTYWLNCLAQGVSREYVFKGFVESEEYLKICNSYGITRGSYSCKQARDQNIGVTGFVTRLYSKALGRTPDTGGLNSWCNVILTKKMTPEAVAEYFITSQEFTDKKLSDEEYIKVLYQTFFGREYDVSGLLYWKEQMKNGATRQSVRKSFAASQEFKTIMAGYGL